MPVRFEWRLDGGKLLGYTITEGRETKIFEIFRRETVFKRILPFRLYRVASNACEDFKSEKLAKDWAENLLSKDVVIQKGIIAIGRKK